MNKFYLFIIFSIIIIILFGLLLSYGLNNYVKIYTKKNIKTENIWNNLNKLDVGDLFLTGKIIGNKKFKIDHAGLIAKYNGKLCIIESINIDKCRENKSILDKEYKTGPKIYYLKDELSFANKVTEKKCYDTVLIRKLNYKKLNITPEELNKKLLTELKIFNDSNSKFEAKYNMYPFAIIGALFWYIPNKEMSNIANIFPTSYYNDGYFCSEFIPLLLQRVGLLDYKYNARIYWPHFLSDNFDYIDKELYHKNLFFSY